MRRHSEPVRKNCSFQRCGESGRGGGGGGGDAIASVYNDGRTDASKQAMKAVSCAGHAPATDKQPPVAPTMYTCEWEARAARRGCGSGEGGVRRGRARGGIRLCPASTADACPQLPGQPLRTYPPTQPPNHTPALPILPSAAVFRAPMPGCSLVSCHYSQGQRPACCTTSAWMSRKGGNLDLQSVVWGGV